MKKIIENTVELIGNTPLLRASRYASSAGVKNVDILTKLEYLNPAGSVKDRVGAKMIEDAEKSGVLKPGGTIIEPTSGNTGIGIASVAAVKGYKVIITLPDSMSVERRTLLGAYGAELVLTDPELSIAGSVDKAMEIASGSSDYFVPQQFQNPANPMMHYRTTAVELVQQLGKKIDVFVSGVGSGGTLQGIAQYLLEQNPDYVCCVNETQGQVEISIIIDLSKDVDFCEKLYQNYVNLSRCLHYNEDSLKKLCRQIAKRG